MAFDTVIDKTQLESAITASANAIREKTGSTDLIEWLADKGFADAIAAIEAGGGGAAPDVLDIFTYGSYTVSEDTQASVDYMKGSGVAIATHIEDAVKTAGKVATGCFACFWDGTKGSSISTLPDNSFVFSACLLNPSSLTHINSGFTNESVSATKGSSWLNIVSKSGEYCYSYKDANLIDQIGSNSGYYRAGRVYNWICIAFTK